MDLQPTDQHGIVKCASDRIFGDRFSYDDERLATDIINGQVVGD